MKKGSSSSRGGATTPYQQELKRFLKVHRVAGLLYHCLLARQMARAGFQVCQVEKQNNHADVWIIRMRRARVPAGRETEWVRNRVCLFLRRHGIRYPKKEVCVVVHGDKVMAAFNWNKGTPGQVRFRFVKGGSS